MRVMDIWKETRAASEVPRFAYWTIPALFLLTLALLIPEEARPLGYIFGFLLLMMVIGMTHYHLNLYGKLYDKHHLAIWASASQAFSLSMMVGVPMLLVGAPPGLAIGILVAGLAGTALMASLEYASREAEGKRMKAFRAFATSVNGSYLASVAPEHLGKLLAVVDEVRTSTKPIITDNIVYAKLGGVLPCWILDLTTWRKEEKDISGVRVKLDVAYLATIVCADITRDLHNEVFIHPRSLTDRLLSWAGPDHRIQFELEAFNQTYNVYSRNRREAYDLLTPKQIEVLMAAWRPMRIEVDRRTLFMKADLDRLEPDDLAPLWNAGHAFAYNIPRHLLAGGKS